ncbi:tetraspanin-8 [Catharus ustulatus]|uniref:tetraspanin-8 n=1 Tax=Catharus ustulatus TaxID=91951 RepID=UPI00140C2E57|nr:tetraspanin-8 [Catharus ustulatus]
MAGVSKCMKYSMFIFNLLFWVCGCIILGISIWIRVTGAHQMDSSMLAGANLLIAVGAIIMILGFLGCCGAVKENRCMLMLFFIALLLILILQLIGGILGAMSISKMDTAFDLILSAMTSKLESTEKEDKPYQENFQNIEREFKCCGVTKGPEDWGKNFNSTMCQCEAQDQSSDLCTKYQNRYIYKNTCGEVIVQQMKNYLTILMGISFGLAVVEIIGLVFSMSLYCQIGRK